MALSLRLRVLECSHKTSKLLGIFWVCLRFFFAAVFGILLLVWLLFTCEVHAAKQQLLLVCCSSFVASQSVSRNNHTSSAKQQLAFVVVDSGTISFSFIQCSFTHSVTHSLGHFVTWTLRHLVTWVSLDLAYLCRCTVNEKYFFGKYICIGNF